MQKVALVNNTMTYWKKSRLRDRTDTDRAWFSRLLRHPARKRSGSILTTQETACSCTQWIDICSHAQLCDSLVSSGDLPYSIALVIQKSPTSHASMSERGNIRHLSLVFHGLNRRGAKSSFPISLADRLHDSLYNYQISISRGINDYPMQWGGGKMISPGLLRLQKSRPKPATVGMVTDVGSGMHASAIPIQRERAPAPQILSDLLDMPTDSDSLQPNFFMVIKLD